MAEELERIFIIPLKKHNHKSSKAAPTALKRVKNYITKHMKVEEKKIWIDDSLNNALWSRGKYKMKSKIRVKAVKFDDGVVEAYLPELEFKKSRRELLREEKEKKTPILRREEPEEGEAGDVSGTEDYDIAPTADGDVKIKKKKPKEEKEDKEEKDKKEEESDKKKDKKKETKKKIEDKKTDKKKEIKKTTDKKQTKKKTDSKKDTKKSSVKKKETKKTTNKSSKKEEKKSD